MIQFALEDSTILQTGYETEQKLKLSNHKFETFFRIAAERTATRGDLVLDGNSGICKNFHK